MTKMKGLIPVVINKIFKLIIMMMSANRTEPLKVMLPIKPELSNT